MPRPRIPTRERMEEFNRGIEPLKSFKAAACALAMGVLWPLVAGVSTLAAGDRTSLLLLPLASGTPGQEWSAQALGGLLEDGFGSLRSVRLVSGAAREVAMRELSVDSAMRPEAFRDICRRAGANLAVLGGSTLVGGRLDLEIRIFDLVADRELPTFRGSESSTSTIGSSERRTSIPSTRLSTSTSPQRPPRPGSSVGQERREGEL